MDLFESLSRSSSSSSQNNSANKSQSSNSSNVCTSYKLKYCASASSSVSPVTNIVYEDLILSSSSPSTQSSNYGLPQSPKTTTTSNLSTASGFSFYQEVNPSTSLLSHLAAADIRCAWKRKRKSSDEKDPGLGVDPPSAKRQQTTSSIYQNNQGSLVSSVYPSPVDELVQGIDTNISTDSLSIVADYEVSNRRDVPDSPSSLRNVSHDIEDHRSITNNECKEVVGELEQNSTDEEDADDEDNSTYDDDDYSDVDNDDYGIVSNTTSPSTSSTSSLKKSKDYTSSSHGLTKVSNNIKISKRITTEHHGERTPGDRYSIRSTNDTIQSCQSKVVSSFEDYANAANYIDCMTPATESETIRQCPLPALAWANALDVWQLMCKKDEEAACLRTASMLDNHPGLQPRMRAILLDWLIEVCEVYKLHRETYYLAVDYLDRYLSAQKKVQKTHLQLIGITCLFIAAKAEEIYPPKIGEFAYVTDGACQESDILQHEILLLQALDWNISPVTPMGWLGVYMQLHVNNRTPASLNNTKSHYDFQERKHNPSELHEHPNSRIKTSVISSPSEKIDEAFIYPQFSGYQFAQTAKLLDLCSLDLGFANYSYSVIAAAAMCHIFNKETALRCSGLDWQAVESCISWMEPFFHVICEEVNYMHLMEQNEQINSKCGLGHICPNIVTDDSHIIQTHAITMTMFERACTLQEQYQHSLAAKLKQEASPATGLKCPEGLLTPPASSRKAVSQVEEEEELRQNNIKNQTVPFPSTVKIITLDYKNKRKT